MRAKTANDPDVGLLRKVARGDQRAAAELMDRRLPAVLSLARRMMMDETEAEDVAQDAFLRVWRAAPNWREGEAKLSTWLHRVTLNLCYDRLRRRREVLVEHPPEQPDSGPGPADGLAAADVSRRVEAAVATLPPRQRAALSLCYYKELSNIDAAAAMEISVEALESLLSRARRTLRRELAGEASELLDGSAL